MCQEALTDVRKHARAAAVLVDMSTVDQGFLVRVTGDGIGLPAGDQVARPFGLVETRERAEAAGGRCTVVRPPDGGTLVEFWLPDVRP
ncbi:ATP-binding protein [Lentzea sp. NPDC042327]|uniref:sensor histidine kinase n=1 Tax=Lentzea sp. NPDC042327 TaxID=3154801 RepID=UPI0033EDCD8F